jgi:hypothetical protein
MTTNKYKLTKNVYFEWHRGGRGIRADVLLDGVKVATLVGNQSSCGGMTTEYSIHPPSFDGKWPDEHLHQITRKNDPIGRKYDNSKIYYSRAHVLECINAQKEVSK